ncbi:TetR/AcrR family transcriptional regulator [Methylobacterium soli]|uniref:TetR family transcriptional regulator n=1 Tax=Methylobacterium soli TaxID=553447 RepID=A0A6L3T3S9_9HYPH|nr:TetR/AcrR family transcriptional regulator [Methylobacterium soli]KAB1079814.1 TetR family transcriptional regulator [Methylobacterium soli]GJE43004.1 HTH-type transcriptional regulator BetI [Methylobacterium soli]
MSAALGTVIEARSGQTARREQILDAAEACFVRNGFHRTTMQDLARAAGMTAGNIYHYFESKEALVLGLAERERARGAALVSRLAGGGDRRAVLMGIINQYFVSIPREAAVLRLDLWSEATRNPAIAAMTARFDEEGRDFFIEAISALATAPDCDPVALFETLDGLMRGIVVNRALRPDYDPAPAAARLRGLLDAGLAGRLPTCPDAAPAPETRR